MSTKRASIRVSLGVLFAVTVGLATAGVGTLAFVSARAALEEARSDTLEGVAQAKEALVIEILHMHAEEIGRIALLHEVRVAVSPEGGAAAPAAGDAVEGVDEPAQVTPDREGEIERSRDLLASLVAHGALSALTVVDASGRVVVSTDPAADARSYSTQAFWSAARHGPTWGDLRRTDAGATYRVSQPIHAAGSRVAGVLVAEVSAQQIYTALTDRTGLGATGESYLIDGEGRLLSPSRFVEDAPLRTRNREGAFEQLKVAARSGGSEWRTYHGSEPVLGFVMFDDFRRAGIDDWAVVCEMDRGEALAAIDALRNDVLIGVLVFALLALFASWVFGRTVTGPLARMAGAAQQMGSGDLTVAPVPEARRDEIGVLSQAFVSMHQSLTQVLRGLRDGLASLARNAVGVSSATSKYARAAEAQAAAIASTSASLAEARQGSAATAQGAKNVLAATEEAAAAGRRGIEAVEAGVQAIHAIEERVRAIATQILELSQRSAQVAQIVATVNDLAEQSNVLAVNASVEAAKAGEHGRGFSVVAAEVRRMAEQSKRATQQIRRILTDIQRATEGVVMAAEDGAKRSEEGKRAIDEIRGTIQELATTLEENAETARRISSSASDQAQGIAQISHALEAITRSGEDAMHEIRALGDAVTALDALGAELNGLAGQYRL